MWHTYLLDICMILLHSQIWQVHKLRVVLFSMMASLPTHSSVYPSTRCRSWTRRHCDSRGARSHSSHSDQWTFYRRWQTPWISLHLPYMSAGILPKCKFLLLKPTARMYILKEDRAAMISRAMTSCMHDNVPEIAPAFRQCPNSIQQNSKETVRKYSAIVMLFVAVDCGPCVSKNLALV